MEAWQDFVEEIDQAFFFPGTELFKDSAEGLGDLAGAAAAAPLSDLMSELELRRGLKFRYFTPWHVKSKAELRSFIRGQLEKDYPPAKVEADEAVLKVLGLVPLDFEIVGFTEDLLTDGVAGAYDPATDQFFLVDSEQGVGFTERWKQKSTRIMLGDTSSTVTIHELDHALGGQHFDLRTKLEALSKTASMDEQIALMALVEGDATFVMLDHSQKNSAFLGGSNMYFAGSDALTEMLVAFPLPLPGMGKFSEAPLFFQKSLIFPYYGGAEFVSTLRHRTSDWSSVDRAYQHLPKTSAEILHPYAYGFFDRIARTPDFSKLPTNFGPWSKVHDESGGEFLLRIVLEQYGVENYRSAAEGWAGDRMRVYRHKKTGGLGLYWAIRWQDAYEQEEFFNSLGSHLPFVVEQESEATIISLALTPPELKTLRKQWD